MNARAIVISDSVTHRVLFLLAKVATDDSGNQVIVNSMTHREIAAPTKDAAVKAAKSIGTDLSRETYAETGAVPSQGRLVIVGAFGLPPALPATKVK